MKYLIPFLSLLTACGGNPAPNPAQGNPPGVASSTETPAKTEALPELTFDPAALPLEGLYATSSAPGHAPETLFDTDPATTWRTRPGAGPDEGIMLYFASPRLLQSITIEAEAGSFTGEVGGIQTYVNGQPGSSGRAGQAIALPTVPVKSLFLRFETTGREENQVLRKGDKEIGVLNYPRDAFIGLRTLTIRDDKGQPLRLAPPARVEGQTTASSTLAPEAAYGADNLFDARKEFVWAEGNTAGDGVGETLTFTFSKSTTISAIQVWNGYQRSDEHYAANARVRDVDFGAKDGPLHTYTLRDSKAGQKITLSAAATGQAFELKIKSVYPGKTYKDLAISELLFFDAAGHPFVPQATKADQFQTTLTTRAAPSPLAAVLDRRVSNAIDDGIQTFTNQSLILRADGTFVLYSSVNDQDDTSVETLADGNWELLDASPAAARVKVFGKWRDLDNVAAYYEGQKSAETTRIFKDELTISADQIVGTKMVGTFYLK